MNQKMTIPMWLRKRTVQMDNYKIFFQLHSSMTRKKILSLKTPKRKKKTNKLIQANPSKIIRLSTKTQVQLSKVFQTLLNLKQENLAQCSKLQRFYLKNQPLKQTYKKLLHK